MSGEKDGGVCHCWNCMKEIENVNEMNELAEMGVSDGPYICDECNELGIFKTEGSA